MADEVLAQMRAELDRECARLAGMRHAGTTPSEAELARLRALVRAWTLRAMLVALDVPRDDPGVGLTD